MVAVLVPSFVLASFVPITLVTHGVVASVNMLTDCHGSTLAHPSPVAFRSTVMHLAKIHNKSQHLKLYNIIVDYPVGVDLNITTGSIDTSSHNIPRDAVKALNKLDFKHPHAGLAATSFYYGGIVPTNLCNTANTAMIRGVFDGSIVTSMPIFRRAPHKLQLQVACKSSSTSYHNYMHGIDVSHEPDVCPQACVSGSIEEL
jgi:hypothetical protein